VKTRVFSRRRALRRKQAGQVSSSLLMPLLLGTFGVGMFLHNAQLNSSYVGWDVVADAGWVAADTANKVLCASPTGGLSTPLGQVSGARAEAVFNAIRPRLKLVTSDPDRDCDLAFNSEFVQPGSTMSVVLECLLPCSIPIAGPLMCPSGGLHVAARHSIQPGGCDRK
jgi:hypothetical protein